MRRSSLLSSSHLTSPSKRAARQARRGFEGYSQNEFVPLDSSGGNEHSITTNRPAVVSAINPDPGYLSERGGFQKSEVTL